MFRAVLTAILVVVGLVSVASAQINLTNGDFSYSWNAASGTGVYSGPNYGGNVLVEEKWIVRFDDNFAFGGPKDVVNLNDSADGEILSSSSDSILFQVNGLSGDPILEVALNFSLSSSGKVDYSVVVSDDDFLPEANDVSVFNYFDVDIDGSSDSATASASEIYIKGGNTGFRKTATGATGFDIRSQGVTNIDDLINTTYNLAGTTSLTNTNVTGAFQWDFSLPNGADQSLSGTISIPEPGFGMLVLVAGIGMLASRRRKNG